MALKEKALKRLAEKLNNAHITWALYGDYVKVLRGEEAAWHGFELTVSSADAEAADKILTRLGMRHEEAPGKIAYHFDGADILLNTALVEGFSADAVGETATVLGVSVPLLKKELCE